MVSGRIMLESSRKKKVTLSVDDRIYDDFMKYCEERGMILSKQVEFFMKEELDIRRGMKKHK